MVTVNDPCCVAAADEAKDSKGWKEEKQAAQMHREIVHGPMLCKKSALPASLKE